MITGILSKDTGFILPLFVRRLNLWLKVAVIPPGSFGSRFKMNRIIIVLGKWLSTLLEINSIFQVMIYSEKLS